MAYLLPIIERLLPDAGIVLMEGAPHPMALIIAPARELARQIYNEARKFATDTPVRIGILYGGTSTPYLVGRLIA
jgi:superfamily II DNA/RNA helicase